MSEGKYPMAWEVHISAIIKIRISKMSSSVPFLMSMKLHDSMSQPYILENLEGKWSRLSFGAQKQQRNTD